LNGTASATDETAIVLSSGEPAGVGPDICVELARDSHPFRLAVLGDPNILAQRAALLGSGVDIRVCATVNDVAARRPGTLQVLAVPAGAGVTAGRLDPLNADYVLELLRRGVDLCLRGDCAALVTAPVQKSIITQAGVPFTGHTEFLADLTGAAQPVMLLVGKGLRVALATTHLPLSGVPAAIQPRRLERTLRVLDADLKRHFAIAAPRILVLGLNPHAGEDGTLGTEERDVIGPVVAGLKQSGLSLIGPVPADTAFTEESLRRCDAVLAMYHDQGLPVLKALAFGEVVNVTLGLPIIRTSVDHGTALPLAGTGNARADSLRAAVALAIELARNRRRVES
jgi:4-hydroxythreonine-4-phosphate dehydrogenase